MDTVSQKCFRVLNKKLLDKVHWIIFMYDFNERNTYKNIETWINELKNNSEYFKPILIGNKKNLDSKRKVTYNDLEKVASKFKISRYWIIFCLINKIIIGK